MEEARWKNCKVGCLESEREGKVDLKRGDARNVKKCEAF